MSKHEFIIRGYYSFEGAPETVYVLVLIPNPPPGRKDLFYVCASMAEPDTYKGDDELRINNATISTCVLEDADRALTAINPKTVSLRMHIAIGVAIERHLLALMSDEAARTS
jgi:hypothetical protein